MPTAQSNPNGERCLHAGRGLAQADHKYLRIVSCGSIIIRMWNVDPAELQVNDSTTLQQDTQYVITDWRGRVLTTPYSRQLQSSQHEKIPSCPAILAPQPITNGIPHVGLAQAEHLSVVLSLLRSIPISHPSPITPITTTTGVLTSPLDHAPLMLPAPAESSPSPIFRAGRRLRSRTLRCYNTINLAIQPEFRPLLRHHPGEPIRIEHRLTSDLPPHFRVGWRRGVTRRRGTSVQGRINVAQVNNVQGPFDRAPWCERGGPLHMPHYAASANRAAPRMCYYRSTVRACTLVRCRRLLLRTCLAGWRTGHQCPQEAHCASSIRSCARTFRHNRAPRGAIIVSGTTTWW